MGIKGSISIVEATAEDIPEIVDMAFFMHGEAPHYRGVPFRPEDMELFLELSIENPDHVVILATDGDRIVGMMGGMRVPYMFNFAAHYACDFGFYVMPQSRGSRAALAMIRYYERWAKGLGVKQARLGESSGIMSAKVDDFLRKMGYNLSGSSYAKEL